MALQYQQKLDEHVLCCSEENSSRYAVSPASCRKLSGSEEQQH